MIHIVLNIYLQKKIYMRVYHKLFFASSAKCELIKSVFVIYFEWNFSAVTFKLCVFTCLHLWTLLIFHALKIVILSNQVLVFALWIYCHPLGDILRQEWHHTFVRERKRKVLRHRAGKWVSHSLEFTLKLASRLCRSGM